MLLKYKYFTLAVLWTIVITSLSLASLKEVPKIEFSNADKIVHACIYFVFTILWFLALYKEKILNLSLKYTILICAFFGILYGIGIEYIQEKLFIHREGDWKDVIANTVGIFTALFVIKYFLLKKITLKTKK